MLTLCQSGWNPTFIFTAALELSQRQCDHYVRLYVSRVYCKEKCECYARCFKLDNAITGTAEWQISLRLSYKRHKCRCALSFFELAFVCLPQKCLKTSPLDSYETLKQHCRWTGVVPTVKLLSSYWFLYLFKLSPVRLSQSFANVIFLVLAKLKFLKFLFYEFILFSIYETSSWLKFSWRQ